MALDHRKGQYVVAEHHHIEQVTLGEDEIGKVHHQEISFKENRGQVVQSPDSLHAETNIYIKQSQQYFPSKSRWMCSFLQCRYFKTLTTLLFCVPLAVLITVTCLVGIFNMDTGVVAVCMGLSFLAVVCSASLLCLFIQHCWVVCCTIRTVLKQPEVPAFPDGCKNKHLEVDINSKEALYLKSRGGVVGVVAQAQGTVRVQVLTTEAVHAIKNSARFSICCCISVLFLAVWAPVMLLASFLIVITSGNIQLQLL